MPRDVLLGWLAPLLITVVAGIFRFVGLGKPAEFLFDEVYYPKDAFALLKRGIEYQFVEGADQRILAGDFDVFDVPAFVVHPPAGKWMIAFGEWVFGMNPFGWRVTVALLGTLSVLVMARLVRRLTRSTLLGCIAGALLALDGLHFTESRLTLLDSIVAFWLLAGLACLVVDRDRGRARLADALEPRTRVHGAGWGPAMLWRPWRILGGVCLGLAVASKWNAVFFLAVFGLVVVFWDMGARKAIGVRFARAKAAVLDGIPAFVSMVGTATVVYVASWFGWFTSADGYHRAWAETRPASGLATLVPDALRSLWHYHHAIWNFHTGLTDDHPYASHPGGWLILSRPVSFLWRDDIGPERGCPTDRCIQEILGIGTPAIWWAGVAAIVACGVIWVGSRDWRFGIPLFGLAATWVPWFLFTNRPQFFFYASVILPWLVIGITLCLGKILGPPEPGSPRRIWGAAIVGGYLVLVLLNFAYLYPILTGQTIPYEDWLERMWFGSWV